MKPQTLAKLSLFIFAFLLGFSLSVQAYAIHQQIHSPLSQYLRENYGVNSIEEYQAKLEQEAWLNISKQMETLANQYPELNFSEWNPNFFRQYGTSSYQPPKITPQQPFYIAIFSEPVTALQIFSLSGLGLIGLAALPPVRKSKRLKQILVLGIVALATFSIGYFVGTISAQTGTIAIEPGSFTETASYVIWTDGTYVYAKNGKTGAIDFSGSDASTVIQSAINASTSGGRIFIKAGTYLLRNSLVLSDYICLEGEGEATVLKLDNGVNKDILKTDLVNIRYKICVSNIKIDGNRANNTSGNGINFFTQLSTIQSVIFNNIPEYAIKMSGTGTNNRLNGIVGNIIERSLGIYLTANSTDILLANNIIRTYSVADLPADALIKIESLNAGGHRIIGNHIICGKTYGISIQDSNNNLIVGNVIDSNRRHGIFLKGVNNVIYGTVIANNLFLENGQETANTYDHIHFDSSVKSNQKFVIVGNTFRSSTYTRYCIGGTGSYNYGHIIIGNNFKDGFVGESAVNFVISPSYPPIIRDNKGYDTENFKVTGLSITIGTDGTYGSAKAISSLSGVITYPRVKITWGGTFGTGETVTVKVEAVYTDGSTAYVEKSATATGSTWLTDDDILALITQGKDIVKLNVYAKTNLSSTTVTVTVDAYGKA